MATFKVTAQRGKYNLKDVIVAAGAAEAQSDTISLNVDFTNMKKGEMLTLLDSIKQKIHAGKFPPL